MNHLLWPTALLAAALFWLGTRVETKLTTPVPRLGFIVIAIVLALPGLLFAAYYTKLLGEPIWLYRFRALRGTELSAAGVGLLAGFLHQVRHKHPQLRKQLRAATVPFILAVIIGAPYVKPLLRPLNHRQLTDRWQDDVCLQSTPSTCGPASAATILKSLGREGTEAELAQESLTYVGGTENWYLARALRRRGVEAEFKFISPDNQSLPTPAIVGVKLPNGSGHFIALSQHDGTNYIGGDPLTGRFSAARTELQSTYQLTGFFLIIR
jgi:hypothetical protein